MNQTRLGISGTGQTRNLQEAPMIHSKSKTFPYSGWLSLCCISLLLSCVMALPILGDLAESHQPDWAAGVNVQE